MQNIVFSEACRNYSNRIFSAQKESVIIVGSIIL